MDHIEKAEELKNTYGGEILISRKGAENINNPEINLSSMSGVELYTSVDSRVDDKDILHIGKIELEVILTPRTYK